LSPLPAWWPILSERATLICLGNIGDENIVEVPTKRGYLQSPLKFPLFLARVLLV
jgi:hypothetical protein